MNPARTIQATFWTMVVLQTVGSVDLPGRPGPGSPLGGAGTRKLPAPRAYVAVLVLWSIFNLAAETGLGVVAARLSVLVVLVGSVVGPFGQKAVSFLEGVSQHFAIAPATGPSSTPGGFPVPGGSGPSSPPAGAGNSGGRVI